MADVYEVHSKWCDKQKLRGSVLNIDKKQSKWQATCEQYGRSISRFHLFHFMECTNQFSQKFRNKNKFDMRRAGVDPKIFKALQP